MGGMKRFLHDVADEMGLRPDDPAALEAAEERLEQGNLPQATVDRMALVGQLVLPPCSVRDDWGE